MHSVAPIGAAALAFSLGLIAYLLLYGWRDR